MVKLKQKNNMDTSIVDGNYVKTSYFTVNGCMAVTIGWDDSKGCEDITEVFFEDGLYKVYKNGSLQMAATSCLIEIKNKYNNGKVK